MDISNTGQSNSINSNDILLKNQIMISKIFAAQCNYDFEGSTNLILQLLPQMQNILAKCQQHPKVLQSIREYREILPEHCIQQNEALIDEGVERYYKYLEKVVNQQTVIETKKDKKKNPWTEEEKQLFEEALKICDPKGNLRLKSVLLDWKCISTYVKTRSPQQVRSHYQKYEKKMRKNRTTYPNN